MRLLQNLTALSIAGLAAASQAAPVSYTISAEQSQLSITSGSILVAGAFLFPAQPLDANGFHAALSGQIDADYTGSSILFASTSRVEPVEHGLYLPGPLGDSSTPAPGSYAIHYPTAPVLGFDFDSITRQLVYEVSDAAAHVVVGGEFPAAGSTWTIISGVADLNAGNPPQSDLTTTAPVTNTTLLNGSIAKVANVETLTVPVRYQMTIPGNLVLITLNYEGTVVATRGVPGCPGDLNHDNVVDDSDFVIFVPAYNLLEVPPANPEADLNNDGVVDDADFVIFVTWYNQLLCS